MKFKLLLCLSLGWLSLGGAFAQASQPYEYLRGEYVVPCPEDENENCIWQRLIVDNQSVNTLECRSRIAYDGVNSNQLAVLEHRMVVEPNTRKAVLGDTTKPEVKSTSHSVDCVVRPPLNDSKLTPNCKPNVTKKPAGGIDYPSASRRAGEEGPVLVEFSFSNIEGPPTDIVVVGSSLWPKLDESAIKYMTQYAGVTDCKTGRFRMPLTFQLKN